jgi:hypothetical protein
MAMARYRTRFLGGQCDGRVEEWSRRPTDGEICLMKYHRGRQASIYQWSDIRGLWLFKELIRKADFIGGKSA